MTRAVVILLVWCGVAAADSPFAALTNPKASWTYDVLKGKKHTPTGIKATLKVTGVHTAGAYTSIEYDIAFSPEQGTSSDYYIQPGTWMIGPQGLREVLFFNAGENGGYTEAYLRSAYDDHYVPRVYLQPEPAAKKKLHWKLNRFGDEDRDYNVTGSIAKTAHGWRTAWKGAYTIPENGEKDMYAWSTELDPAVGFTEICVEGGFCLRLATP